MKRPASEYATLLALLDEALELPEVTERAGWIDRLPELHAGLRPTLRRMLLETAALDPASPCVQSHGLVLAFWPRFVGKNSRSSQRWGGFRSLWCV